VKFFIFNSGRDANKSKTDKMRKFFSEQTILFISVLKWILLATITGVIVGLSTWVFLKALDISTNFTKSYDFYFLALPVGLMVSTLLVMYLAPDAEGHGTEKVISAVHKSSGDIKIAVVPVKLIATIATIATGGSAGKEGPCAQIGAGLASSFAKLLKLNPTDRKKLVICGISAGFSSVFGTPIAGAIFGVEVLYIGDILYDVLLPSFISGIISYHVTSSLGITYFHHPIKFSPVFSEMFFIKVIVAGIFFGICARIFIEVMDWFENFQKRINLWKVWKSFAGGLFLVILTFIFSKQYLGLGLDTIQYAIEGGNIVWYAFLLKIVFTSVTLNFGGSGGVVTPLFFVGATAGSLFAKIFGLNASTFSAIGFVAVLAGATNAPISASIMSVELFGPGLAPYASVACIISFIMTGHKSIYPSQVLSIAKSPSIEVETGKEIEYVTPKAKIKRNGLSYLILNALKKFENLVKGDRMEGRK